MTTKDLVPLAIEFSIRSVILFAALAITLKLIKQKFNFAGLLASALLASGVGLTVEYFLGLSLAALATVIVLAGCITMATEADHVAIGFTVAVSFGITFGLSLLIFGTLLGEMKVSARRNDKSARNGANSSAQASGRTGARGSTNGPAGTQAPEPPSLAKQMAEIFVLKGVTGGTAHPTVFVSTGKSSFTVFMGEAVEVETPKGPVTVFCKKVEANNAVLEIEGEEITLTFVQKANPSRSR